MGFKDPSEAGGNGFNHGGGGGRQGDVTRGAGGSELRACGSAANGWTRAGGFPASFPLAALGSEAITGRKRFGGNFLGVLSRH